MYNSWMDAFKNKEITGLTLVDLSATFNCVNTDLIMAKLKLYKFNQHTCKWVGYFMTGRPHVMKVKASASSALRLEDIGVPQGSILAPIWYINFTNKLPAVVHFNNCGPAKGRRKRQGVQGEAEEVGGLEHGPRMTLQPALHILILL